MLFAIPCGLSLFISCIHSYLFSDWRRTVSFKFFDTQVSSISTEKLVLPHHARCVLSRLCCNEHSLLLSSYLSRIGRIENPSCSACRHLSQKSLISFGAVQLRTLCAAHSLVTLCLSLQPLLQALECCPAYGAPWSFAMPPYLGRSRVATTTTSRISSVYS